jgi:hypothetical protein
MTIEDIEIAAIEEAVRVARYAKSMKVSSSWKDYLSWFEKELIFSLEHYSLAR